MNQMNNSCAQEAFTFLIKWLRLRPPWNWSCDTTHLSQKIAFLGKLTIILQNISQIIFHGKIRHFTNNMHLYMYLSKAAYIWVDINAINGSTFLNHYCLWSAPPRIEKPRPRHLKKNPNVFAIFNKYHKNQTLLAFLFSSKNMTEPIIIF